jgi:acetyl esterase/lipase
VLGRLLRRARRRPGWAPDVVHRYGSHPDQFLEVALPRRAAGRAPVAVVLHGGFWRAAYGIELARPLAADLVAAGWAAVAVEYRRVGSGGGWPATLEDVAAALDVLPDLPVADRLDLGRLTVIGHSAGGHLAAWAAGRARLPMGAPGAAPRVRIATAVLQAGVVDLVDADRRQLGNGAVRNFLGDAADELPDRLATADPVRLLPTEARVLCVHGADDETVPPGQSRSYATAARAAGDHVDVRIVPGDHRSLIDPAGPAWRLVRDWLTASPSGGRPGLPWDA